MTREIDNILNNTGQIAFNYSRSGGPGGQNVNKLNTRVTLLLDVIKCPYLSEAQKSLVLNNLATRIDKNGVLRIVSQKYRTQKANRQAAIDKLRLLLEEALYVRPERKQTPIPYSASQKRLRDKKHRSTLKQQRSEKGFGDDF